MPSSFERNYPRLISIGLLLLVWFAALNRAAFDLWAATVLFSGITLLSLLFLVGRWLDQRPIKVPLWGPFLLFILTLFCSLSHSFDLDTTHLELAGWIYAILTFYLFINTHEDTSSLDRFFTWTGCVIIPLAAFSLWQQLTGEPMSYGLVEIPLHWIKPGLALPIRYGHWEIHATLINSIVLAGFVLNWLPFYGSKWANTRRTYAIPLMASLLCVVLSRSWWAYVMALLAYAVWHRDDLRHYVFRYPRRTIFLLAISLIILGGMYHAKTHHREADGHTTASYNPGSRAVYWSTAIRMGLHVPTGIGLGAFGTAYPFFRTGRVENTRFAHGFLLGLFAETGVPGLTAFLLFLIAYGRQRLRKDTRTHRIHSLTIFDVTLGLVFLYSLISIHMDYLLNKLVFLMILGATLHPTSSPLIAPRRLWMATGGLSLILGSALWLPWLPASRHYVSGLYYEQTGETATAERLYQNAIELNPYLADAYWRLARIHMDRYAKTHSPEDTAAARRLLQNAFIYKRDTRYLNDLSRLDKPR
jgi:hypothetical protein